MLIRVPPKYWKQTIDTSQALATLLRAETPTKSHILPLEWPQTPWMQVVYIWRNSATQAKKYWFATNNILTSWHASIFGKGMKNEMDGCALKQMSLRKMWDMLWSKRKCVCNGKSWGRPKGIAQKRKLITWFSQTVKIIWTASPFKVNKNCMQKQPAIIKKVKLYIFVKKKCFKQTSKNRWTWLCLSVCLTHPHFSKILVLPLLFRALCWVPSFCWSLRPGQVSSGNNRVWTHAG